MKYLLAYRFTNIADDILNIKRKYEGKKHFKNFYKHHFQIHLSGPCDPLEV